MNPKLNEEKRGSLTAHAIAFVAGLVDAVGYIVLFRMFTANMSGNSVIVGIGLGTGTWHRILHRGFPLPLFMIGIMLGSFIIVLLKRHGSRYTFQAVFLLEALLIFLFWLVGSPVYSGGEEKIESSLFYAIAALPALAMGLQTAALHRIGSFSIRTSVVTGMLATGGRELVNYLFWLRDHLPRRRTCTVLRVSFRHASFIRMGITLGIWLFYMIGAVAGAALLAPLGLTVLLIPTGILLMIVVFTLPAS